MRRVCGECKCKTCGRHYATVTCTSLLTFCRRSQSPIHSNAFASALLGAACLASHTHVTHTFVTQKITPWTTFVSVITGRQIDCRSAVPTKPDTKGIAHLASEALPVISVTLTALHSGGWKSVRPSRRGPPQRQLIVYPLRQ